MTDQDRRGDFIQRIPRLLRLLEENHLETDQAPGGGWPPAGLSAPEQAEMEAAWAGLRFMDEMPGGFFIFYANQEERLMYASRGARHMFGCATLQELRALTGDSLKGIVCQEDLGAVEDALRRQVEAKKYDLDYLEYRIRRKDGIIRWVEGCGHFIRSEEVGDVFCIFLGDPTDERNQEQIRQKHVLSDALEKADLAMKAKNEFLSQISHEMRTPLNAVFGYTALAKASLGDPAAAAGYLAQVETASRQLLDMISQALNMSSLSGTVSSVHEECDLREALQEVYDFLLPQAQEKGLAFSLECGGIVHGTVYTDRQQLEQLVLNLANNAITYTESGGVDIFMTEERAQPDNHAFYRLEVRDTGVGIGEEFLEQAFEPFSRGKGSALSGVRGIGLGLTIAKGIADLLEGDISVKSVVGKGSTFTVTLPFLVQPLEKEPGSARPGPARSLRILLAEDNELNREIETELLERVGFIIDPAADGQEAWDKARAASPGDYDLVLLDLQMPFMDGWEVASAIRRLPDPAMARIPIVALSANVSIHDRRRSMESGIDVHLTKPMDMTVLLETIGKLTGGDAGA